MQGISKVTRYAPGGERGCGSREARQPGMVREARSAGGDAERGLLRHQAAACGRVVLPHRQRGAPRQPARRLARLMFICINWLKGRALIWVGSLFEPGLHSLL